MGAKTLYEYPTECNTDELKRKFRMVARKANGPIQKYTKKTDTVITKSSSKKQPILLNGAKLFTIDDLSGEELTVTDLDSVPMVPFEVDSEDTTTIVDPQWQTLNMKVDHCDTMIKQNEEKGNKSQVKYWTTMKAKHEKNLEEYVLDQAGNNVED